MLVVIESPFSGSKSVSKEQNTLAVSLKRTVVSYDKLQLADFYLVCNGRIVNDDHILQDGCIYHVVPRLCGGKGGFGSMLRAIGAQIEKTTNREACRDISGRRMRDVNNEKKLREWVAKAADREKEREQRRKERRERRLAVPKHNFDDPNYHEQKGKVLNSLEEAVQQGLQRAAAATAASALAQAEASTSSRKKRKAADDGMTKMKKACQWLGVDMDNLSDLSSESDSESDGEEEEADTNLLEALSLNFFERSGDCEAATTVSDSSSTSEVDGACSIDQGDAAASVKSKATKGLQVKSMAHEKDTERGTVIETGGNEEPEKKAGLLDILPHPERSASPPASQCTSSDQKSETIPEKLDLEDCSSVEELEVLGLDRLKSALLALGMKCGGTLNERSQRLWAVRGLSTEEIPKSLLARPMKGKNKT